MQTKLLIPDGIPVKFIKMSANGIDSHLAYIINEDRDQSVYSKNPTTVTIRPIFNEDKRYSSKL